jgi:hypothetical protein
MKTKELSEISLLTRRSHRSWLILVGIAIILLFPYATTIAPEWKIRVVDETGKPYVRVRVQEFWDHYSYDVSGYEERDTDENGYVVFPRRTFIAPLLYRGLRSMWAHVLTAAHGSLGIHVMVRAVTPERSSELIKYKPGDTLVKEIVLKR